MLFHLASHIFETRVDRTGQSNEGHNARKKCFIWRHSLIEYEAM
jgi:hypothetical protein